MANLVSDVVNQSLDAIGWPDRVLGDIEDGSREAQIALRAYRQCLMSMLRAANWAFARKQAPLTLLADATGNTPDVGTVVPQPWLYEYAYPIDCMRIRFVPQNLTNQADLIPAGNIQIPSTPLTTGIGNTALLGQRIQPARFVVSTDFNYPPPDGQITWEVQGVSPEGRTVILTNVRYATAGYTSLVLYPSVWDPLFRAALVAYLASELALPIWSKADRKFGLQMREQQIMVVKAKVEEARLIDGSEGTPSSDISVDWMRTRRSGASGWGSGSSWGWNGGSDGPGWNTGWDSLQLANGVVF